MNAQTLRPLIALIVAIGLLSAVALTQHSGVAYQRTYTPLQLYNAECIGEAASGCQLIR